MKRSLNGCERNGKEKEEQQTQPTQSAETKQEG